MSSNVPLPTIDDLGVNAPSSEAIFNGVIADFAAAFGTSAMSEDKETPQGQLATSFSATLQAFIDLFLAFVSRVDPATSSGRMQDAIGRFFNITRIAASYTVVTATLTGQQGTPIPSGALAKTQGNDIFASVGPVVIPASGSIDAVFQCVTAGPIACPAGYLNEIYQGVGGWDTISNALDGLPGRNVEGPQEFEVRRQAELTKNGRGFNTSMRALLLDQTDGPGCIDAYVTDNPTTSPITVRGITIPAGALYVCVDGGTDADVAKAIWRKKSPGTPYYAVNPVNVTVEDDESGYAIPYPTYPVTFDRAIDTGVAVLVELSNEQEIPADVQQLVQGAVLGVFAGTDVTGKGAPSMGSRLLASRFYAPVTALGDWANIVTIKVGPTGSSPTADYVDMNANQRPASSAADITVVEV